MSTNIGLSVTPARLEVTAGETVTANLIIRNQSQIVDHFIIRVEGLDPTWWTLSIPTFSLFPGDQGQATLTLHPPKEAEAKAGGYSFRVIAASQANPMDMTVAEAFLLLRGFVVCEVDMSPTRVTGASGTYRIVANNRGNADAVLIFEARDPEEGLVYQFDRDRVTVPAGGTARVQLTVKPKKGEPKKLYSFQVISRPADVRAASREVKTLNGQLEYIRRRKFPWWIILLILALLVAVFLAWKLLLQPAPVVKPPPTPPTPTPAPEAPPTINIKLTEPDGGEKWQVGSTQNISWETTNPELAGISSVNIEYSTDRGKTWSTIASVRGSPGVYVWKVPDTASNECLVRITIRARTPSGELVSQDTSNEPFSIWKFVIIPPRPIEIIPPKPFEMIPIVPK